MVEPYFDDTLRDGRRQSNPLTDPSSHVVRAPQSQLWKNALADDVALVNGALPGVGRASGINFADYQTGVVQLVPRNGTLVSSPAGGTSNPVPKLLEWNAGLGLFVDTGLTTTGAGAGKAASWQFAAQGRIVYVYITGVTAGQSVSLYTQGSNEEVR